MQAWRSRLLPTYPPLNRPNLPNTTLANSNSSTTPSRGLRPAKRARSRGRCGPPEETSAMVAVADLSLLAYPRRSSSPRCPGSGEDPLILGLGGGNSRLETFPEMSAPGDFREALETRQEGISTRPPFALSVSRGESHEERQKCGEEGRSQVHSNASSWPSPRGQRQGRALLGEKR